MNVFRLVLFLAGLAAYLLAKQFLPSAKVSELSPNAGVSVTSAPVEWVPVTPRVSTAPLAEGMNMKPAVIGLRKSTEQ